MATRPKRRVVRLYGQQATERKGYERERSDDLYHTSRWTRMSRAFRETHPLCEECRRRGITRAAEVTDHVEPYPLCDFWDETNWQALCKRCNAEKGNRDKRKIETYRKQCKEREKD